MHTIEPWLAKADGSPWNYLDVDVVAHSCDDAFDGALGQTYKCTYVSGSQEFKWSHDQEDGFWVPSLFSHHRVAFRDSACDLA